MEDFDRMFMDIGLVQKNIQMQHNRPICTIKIDLGEEIKEIVVKQNDDITRLAQQFCIHNDLQMEAVDVIYQEIQDQLKQSNAHQVVHQNKHHHDVHYNRDDDTLDQIRIKEEELRADDVLDNESSYKREKFYHIVKQICDETGQTDEFEQNQHTFQDSLPNIDNDDTVNIGCQSYENENQNDQSNKEQVKEIQNSKNYGEYLYNKQKSKQQYLKEIQKQKDLEKQQQIDHQIQQMFKPKISENSKKILQQKKQGPDIYKRKKNIESNHQKLKKEFQECTFNPHINGKSKLYNKMKVNELNTFDNLYQDRLKRQEKVDQQRILENENLNFKPELNRKSMNLMKNQKGFMERQEEFIQQKENSIYASKISKDQEYRQKQQYGQLKQQSYQSTSNNDYQSRQEYLYQKGMHNIQKKKQNEQEQMEQLKRDSQFTVSSQSHRLYLKQKQQVFQKLFEILDSDNDGFISQSRIQIESLPSDILKIMMPVFQEIELLDAEIEFEFFRSRMENQFDNHYQNYEKQIMWNWLNQKERKPEHSFQPILNQTSLRLAEARKKQKAKLANNQ